MNINKYQRSSGFTLLELLIIIGIIAIVGVIVMLIVNPAEMFSQSRDTRRMVDLKNIDSAMRLARQDSVFMGNPNTVYISSWDQGEEAPYWDKRMLRFPKEPGRERKYRPYWDYP